MYESFQIIVNNTWYIKVKTLIRVVLSWLSKYPFHFYEASFIHFSSWENESYWILEVYSITNCKKVIFFIVCYMYLFILSFAHEGQKMPYFLITTTNFWLPARNLKKPCFSSLAWPYEVNNISSIQVRKVEYISIKFSDWS